MICEFGSSVRQPEIFIDILDHSLGIFGTQAGLLTELEQTFQLFFQIAVELFWVQGQIVPLQPVAFAGEHHQQFQCLPFFFSQEKKKGKSLSQLPDKFYSSLVLP